MISNSMKSTFFNSIQDEGLYVAIKRTFLWVLRRLNLIKSDPVRNRRIQISNQLNILFNSTVKYGPFNGLKLSENSWSGLLDRGSMLLGIYEKEVLESLANASANYSTFIDLGASDGYYSIGVLINNLFDKTICFEMRNSGREVIRANAQLNNVLQRVEILGAANNNFYKDIPPKIRESSVLLVDIEGAEFDLLDKSTFKAFEKSIIFVEIHDFQVKNGKEKLNKLKIDSQLTHVITELTMGARDLSNFPELKMMNDTDRWLICSEERSQLMTWLRFDPIG